MHKILFGDVWAALTTLEDHSIDCVVTSPPYWAQRDYGFKGQIGNELSLPDYLAKLVTIFTLMRQKLKPKGNFFLNIGDKYVSKYGNTPLAMIPYLLAFYLVRDGWNLEDIIIWYKPNHMPTPVKNRLTNTYEPIFVFSRSNENHYAKYKQKVNLSNILKIPLQPVPYKHLATYPERLVETLLRFDFPNDALILDPFAGSGTTCKAVQNISEGYFNPIKMRSIMIEANKEYVKIIKQRCNIKNTAIQKIPYRSYEIHSLTKNYTISKTEDEMPKNSTIQPSNVI
ncbi:MAG: DNA-methyltransferase, partial [Candidatus Hodarchaeota archaeon]